MFPHAMVHRGSDPPGFLFQLPREKKRAERIVAKARGKTVDRISSRRTNERKVGGAGEFDVIEGPTRLPEIAKNGPATQTFQCRRTDKTQCGGCGRGLHRHTRLCESGN